MPALVDPEKCDACGNCQKECPTSAIEVTEKAFVKAEECIDCAACVDVCESKAITMQ
jgi:ferredoxin